MELGLCMASYPGFLWLLHSWVCLVSMENKQKSASMVCAWHHIQVSFGYYTAGSV